MKESNEKGILKKSFWEKKMNWSDNNPKKENSNRRTTQGGESPGKKLPDGKTENGIWKSLTI